MRNKVGIVVLAMMTLAGVALAAGPSAAQPVATPKGRVFFGIQGVDNSRVVVALGQGANPVPLTMIDYASDGCINNDGVRRPAIIAGTVNVGAPEPDGTRFIVPIFQYLLCANEAMTMIPAGVAFHYRIDDDTLVSASQSDPFVLARICNGKAVPGVNTIIGTAGPDNLNGTGKMDIIDGRAGNDTIKGKGGNDIICAGKGADVAHGNGGLDLVLGQDGKDSIFGNAYKDVLLGGKNGGTGKEVINGGADWDTLFGWLGNDKLLGKGGNDVIYGGPGADNIFGGPGTDKCFDPAGKNFFGCEI